MGPIAGRTPISRAPRVGPSAKPKGWLAATTTGPERGMTGAGGRGQGVYDEIVPKIKTSDDEDVLAWNDFTWPR